MAFSNDVVCISTLRSSVNARVLHLSVVIEEEEAPKTQLAAANQLTSLNGVNEEVPDEIHE